MLNYIPGMKLNFACNYDPKNLEIEWSYISTPPGVDEEYKSDIAGAIKKFYEHHGKTLTHNLEIPELSLIGKITKGELDDSDETLKFVSKVVIGPDSKLHISFGDSKPTEEQWKNSDLKVLAFRKAFGITGEYFKYV